MARTQESNIIKIDELVSALEPVIRRVVREELTRFLHNKGSVFNLTPDMPLYEDMEEISERKIKGQKSSYTRMSPLEKMIPGQKICGNLLPSSEKGQKTTLKKRSMLLWKRL
jgi:hypothetical protein